MREARRRLVPVRLGEVGLDGASLLEMGDGLLVSVQPPQNVTEIVVGLGIVRLDRNRSLVMCDGIIAAAQLLERAGEVIVSFGKVGSERERLFILRHRFRIALEHL